MENQKMRNSEISNNVKEFTVVAGEYEQGYYDDENIKFTSELMTLKDAIATAIEYMNYQFCFIGYNYQFCFIEYYDTRLTLH